LQDTVRVGHNHSHSLPQRHAQALQEALPPISEVAGDADTTPAASDGDFFVSKAVIPFDEEISFIRFLLLRNPRTTTPTPMGQGAMPSSLLVAVQTDGIVQLFAPSGELALTFSADHEFPITQLTVSPLHDEYVIATGDAAGFIRVHKVNARHRRMAKEKKTPRKKQQVIEDKISPYIGSQMNVTAQFNRQIKMPRYRNSTERPRMTALALASQQGTKYFVVGDADGKVTIFTRNGTLHARLDTGANSSVLSFSVHLSNILFRAGDVWGFVDLERLQAIRVTCPRFDGKVTAAILDTQQSSRVIAADEEGSVWVFNIKNRRVCKIEHRFARGAVRPPMELASVRGYALALEHGRGARGLESILALNMSHVGKKRDDPARAISAVVWRRWCQPVKSWAVHRRYQQGDLLAFLSEDGHEIEIAELLMQTYTPPAGDTFGNFKLPVFAVAIVLVLGYQYVKQQGAFDPGLAEA